MFIKWSRTGADWTGLDGTMPRLFGPVIGPFLSGFRSGPVLDRVDRLMDPTDRVFFFFYYKFPANWLNLQNFSRLRGQSASSSTTPPSHLLHSLLLPFSVLGARRLLAGGSCSEAVPFSSPSSLAPCWTDCFWPFSRSVELICCLLLFFYF